jgi:hypothetical protein
LGSGAQGVNGFGGAAPVRSGEVAGDEEGVSSRRFDVVGASQDQWGGLGELDGRVLAVSTGLEMGEQRRGCVTPWILGYKISSLISTKFKCYSLSHLYRFTSLLFFNRILG